MKFIIHNLILLFFTPIYLNGQETSISLSNYGMLTIGNSESYIGEHDWKLIVSNQDTSLLCKKPLQIMIILCSLT